MASPIQAIVNAQLANSAGILFTSPGGIWTQIISLTCVNADSSTHQVTFHLVPSGGSPITANKSTILQALLPNQTWNSPNEYGKVLNPGDTLQGFADAASFVNVFVSAILASS